MLPPRTLSASGAVQRLLPECAAFGGRGMLVHGRSLGESGELARILATTPPELVVRTWQHEGGEPSLDQLQALLAEARTNETTWIAAVGGGSVIDLAKACAGLLHAPLAPAAYHDGADIPASTVPFVAAPTTAGTGSEATIVSVLTHARTGVKKSIRHPSFIPRLVILDPALLSSCPASVIASAGMDAMTQAVESYSSVHATWISEQFARQGLAMIAGSLERAYNGGGGRAGADLLTGSYLAGLALSNARLGIVHGLAHPLGARYHAPHGLVCAVCLPHAVEFNRQAMGTKYEELSTAIGGDLLTETRRFLTALNVPSPFAGQPVKDQTGIVRETLASGSTAANPRPVTGPDVEFLLSRLFAG